MGVFKQFRKSYENDRKKPAQYKVKVEESSPYHPSSMGYHTIKGTSPGEGKGFPLGEALFLGWKDRDKGSSLQAAPSSVSTSGQA